MSEQSTVAKVEKITPLTDRIMQLVLTPGHYVDYQAGQYLQILFEGEAFSYSIANAPLGSHQYELHIRHSLDNEYNQALFAHIKKEGTLNLRLPYGECSINALDLQRPILFIAGGTGFAPVNAIIEQLLADAHALPFELYWGARSQSDLYLDEKVMSWQRHVDHFSYFSLLSHENKEGLAAYVLAKHPLDLQAWQIVLGGPFDMVYSIRDALVAQGISPGQLFSDAFYFERTI